MSFAASIPAYNVMKSRIPISITVMKENRPRLMSFAIALLFHAVIFLLGGVIFFQAPQYGIDVSQSGVDIYLVAAPARERPLAVEPIEKQVIQKAVVEVPVPKLVEAEVNPEKIKVLQAQKESEHRGDGSSAAAGESQTTFSSTGGGQTEEKPGYLKNPPPSYPSEAVSKGQEGLVMLSASIDRRGYPQNVAVIQSSGFPLLDAAAFKAVRKWKFSPAKMGALTTDSNVTVPIRFRLEDLKKK